MDNLTRFKAQRYLYLEMLDLLSEGCPECFVSFLAMQAQLGWDIRTRRLVEEFLQQEGFIDFPLYGRVCITPEGIAALNGAQLEPTLPTMYFPPVQKVIVQDDGSVTFRGEWIGRTNVMRGKTKIATTGWRIPPRRRPPSAGRDGARA